MYRNLANYAVPQTKPIPGTTQVANNAGGFAWKVDDWQQLERFLVLGSNGTYYVNPQEMTYEAAAAVARCIKADGDRTVQTIRDISFAGRAYRNDPALFALAMCVDPKIADLQTRKLAFSVLPDVARIGTHLFHFVAFATKNRGWGRGLREAVANWYRKKGTAYQLLKYQQRDGWSHRDLLRLAHPFPVDGAQSALFGWATGHLVEDLALPETVQAYETLKVSKSLRDALEAISKHGLSWEMLPTELLTSQVVWEALLRKGMPATALTRNLGRLLSLGLLTDTDWDNLALVRSVLCDREMLKKARYHPLQALYAICANRVGHGVLGSLEWRPSPAIAAILEKAFYTSFDVVEPTGKRILLGLDVSGSMDSALMGSYQNKSRARMDASPSAAMASGALAMTFLRTEESCAAWGFAESFRPLAISRASSLETVLQVMRDANYGSTDCAVPMVVALRERIPVDAFVILTDSETWHGRVHPMAALNQYRREMGIPAKLVVVAMQGTPFSIGDPNDAGCLDVCGMDTTVPTVISDFIRGSTPTANEGSEED